MTESNFGQSQKLTDWATSSCPNGKVRMWTIQFFVLFILLAISHSLHYNGLQSASFVTYSICMALCEALVRPILRKGTGSLVGLGTINHKKGYLNLFRAIENMAVNLTHTLKCFQPNDVEHSLGNQCKADWQMWLRPKIDSKFAIVIIAQSLV